MSWANRLKFDIPHDSFEWALSDKTKKNLPARDALRWLVCIRKAYIKSFHKKTELEFFREHFFTNPSARRSIWLPFWEHSPFFFFFKSFLYFSGWGAGTWGGKADGKGSGTRIPGRMDKMGPSQAQDHLARVVAAGALPNFLPTAICLWHPSFSSTLTWMGAEGRS